MNPSSEDVVNQDAISTHENRSKKILADSFTNSSIQKLPFIIFFTKQKKKIQENTINCHITLFHQGEKKTCSKTRYERFIYGVSTYREREGEREKGTADRGITSENHRCKLFPLHSGQPRASVSACRYIAIAECFSRCYISSWP